MAKKKTKKTNHGLTMLPLGGLGEIGMNLMVIECDGDMLIVDAGVTFSDEQAPGVDLVMADIHYVRANIDRLKGVVITHAHEDHIGAMPYIWDDFEGAPVYLTKFARCILEHKLNDIGIGAKSVKDQINTVEVGKPFKVGCFEMEYVNVTHSIPEGNAILFRTPHGNIFHTGDFKLDKTPVLGEPSDLKRIKEIGDEGVLAMTCDSTNVFREEEAGSESDLAERLDDVIRGSNNRIVFCTFSSNLGRLLKVSEIAASLGKKICYLSMSSRNMSGYAKKLGIFPEHVLKNVIDADEAKNVKREDLFVVAAGTQGETRSALWALSKGEMVRGLSLQEGDTIIMSSKMIPGNERAIYNLMNNMLRNNYVVKHEKTHDIHVSGHAGRNEMKEMYDLVRPQIAVPVHGEYAHLKAHAAFAKEIGVPEQFLITNGTKLYLGPKEPCIVEEENIHGRNYVDGYNILDQDRFILRERRKMAMEGAAFVTIVIDKKENIIEGPQVKSRGVIDEKIQGDVIEAAEAEVTKALAASFGNGKIGTKKETEELMRQAVRRAFGRERGRKPHTIPMIVKI